MLWQELVEGPGWIHRKENRLNYKCRTVTPHPHHPHPRIPNKYNIIWMEGILKNLFFLNLSMRLIYCLPLEIFPVKVIPGTQNSRWEAWFGNWDSGMVYDTKQYVSWEDHTSLEEFQPWADGVEKQSQSTEPCLCLSQSLLSSVYYSKICCHISTEENLWGLKSKIQKL